jgi:hypothetical protein
MKFYSSARNFIYCRRNSSLVENNSAAVAKLIRGCRGSFLCHNILLFLGVFTYQRRISYIEEEHHAQN